MKKVLVSLAAVGLLISASQSFAQTSDTKSSATPPAATDSSKAGTDSKATSDTKASGERRTERRGDGDRASRSSRTTVGVRVGDRDELHHRRGTEWRHDGYRHHGCRIVIVKKRYDHRVVVRKIRRCS